METIWKKVSALPYEQSTVLKLRFLENKNLEEIASVRFWLHTAMEGLRT